MSEPDTANKYPYTRNGPVDKVDPSGMFDLRTVAATTIIGAALATASIYSVNYLATHVYDNRTVYLDFTGISTGDYPTQEVVAAITSTVQEAYAQYKVNFTTTPGVTRRSVTFNKGVFSPFGDPMGQTILVFSRIHTTVIIDQCERYMKPLSGNKLSGTEIGIAIGNVTAHEIGHGFDVPHIARSDLPTTNQPKSIMDEYYVPDSQERLKWAPSSAAYLRDRLK